MDLLDDARDQLVRATGMEDILSTAHAAFMAMLPVIVDQQDRGGHAFPAFVMAGASAASGRFAVAAAPSFRVSARAVEVKAQSALGMTSQAAAQAMTQLGGFLARRLDEATLTAADAADRQACTDAARHARALCAYLGGAPPG